MKIFYLSIPVLLLFLIGCSSTYKVSNFSSKDKFYEDFNKSAGDKTVKITLSNDSSFFNINAEIVNDTLYCMNKKIENLNKKIFLSDIKEIKYSGSNFRKGLILLKDGKTFDADEIKIDNDTVSFSYINAIITLNHSISINRVKEVSYKNHWMGIPGGLIPGFICGLGVGFLIGDTIPTDNSHPAKYLAIVYGPILGVIIGSVWGWLNGRTYTYQFNH
jgi:hypothetical protein